MNVYFIRPVGMEGPVKIGLSKDPEARLAQLNHFSPLPLEIAARVEGGRDLECQIQDCFADQHSHCEWFLAHPRLSKAIADLQAGIPVGEAIDLADRRGNMRGNVIRAAMSRNGTDYYRGPKRRVAA
jgi:hypothetical protein